LKAIYEDDVFVVEREDGSPRALKVNDAKECIFLMYNGGHGKTKCNFVIFDSVGFLYLKIKDLLKPVLRGVAVYDVFGGGKVSTDKAAISSSVKGFPMERIV